ncbi:MAG TPA: 3-oxoacyl-[acyl-carrier-protein] synthase III C-terminal domain-containing protein [Verrucomicrobiae bacterium]
MFIQGVGTATPEFRYTQRDCWNTLAASQYLSKLSGRSQAILRKVLTGDSGIETRSFAMSNLDEAFSLDPNTLHRRFAENAPKVASAAAERAFATAAVTAHDIDALVVSTCTGYLCPGLTSYISEQLGLRPGIYLADMVGHGCGAALPNLQLANALIASGQAHRVLCICVEICSAAFYLDNDPGVLISACLFGDGAGAVIVGKDPSNNLPHIEWRSFQTILNTRDRELLRFETRDGMLRNVLDKSVPLLVVEHVRQVLDGLLNSAHLPQTEIQEWIVHSGGRDVLAALQSGLQIPAEKLNWSAQVLREHGNVSSPSVIFALEKALAAKAPGGTWFLSAFGAGISCHGALLDVRW